MGNKKPRNGGGGRLVSSDEDEKRRFNEFLVEAICESMDFGEVVLHFLELRSDVRRDEIAEKPEVFAGELEGLLGDSAKIIEERIVKKLYSILNIEYEETVKGSFPELIRKALKTYLKKTS